MPKTLSFRRGLSSVLFWSVISAAFIGPGTVTTAAKSGSGYGLDLLWALVFSIAATILLQEAAARITIASGHNLGEIIRRKYTRPGQWRLRVGLFLAVALGCAAYEAGNILGALSGLELFLGLPRAWTTLALGLACAAFLWIGSYRIIANLLGAVVALMGVAFVYVSFGADLQAGSLSQAFLPRVQPGNALLIIGLIGTTIVPYNLFLASGISRGQDVVEMRWGIALAVLIGGIISVAIMVVGTQVAGDFSFAALSEAMSVRMGRAGSVLFGLGLFAAGLSSAITSPFAAAVTAQSLLSDGGADWSPRSGRFRLVWGIVLGVGLFFGMLEIKPVPAIILAQAVNGVLLPVVAVFLLLAVNDRQMLPAAFLNSRGTNVILLLIVGITCFLGLHNVWRAIAGLFPAGEGLSASYYVNGGLSLGIVMWLAVRIFRKTAP